jgi:hypothetical protein
LEVVRSSWWPCRGDGCSDGRKGRCIGMAAYSDSVCHSDGQNISCSNSHRDVYSDGLSGDHKDGRVTAMVSSDGRVKNISVTT